MIFKSILKKYNELLKNQNELLKEYNELLEARVRDLEQNQLAWIPCERRLPVTADMKVVCYREPRKGYSDDGTAVWIGWHEMENVWYIDGEEHSKERGNEVIAWMPIPEYEGENNEDSTD